MQTGSLPLIPSILGNREEKHFMYACGLVLLGSVILSASGKVTVPFWPVPMTLQTFALFFISAAYGRNLAVATVMLYLAEGAVGLPVFAAGGGISYLTGPTGGYLAGFLVSAAIVGSAVDRGYGRDIIRLLAAMLAGELVILVLGAAWLAILFGLPKAFTYGVGPFIVADMIKLAAAACVVSAMGSLLRRIRRD